MWYDCPVQKKQDNFYIWRFMKYENTYHYDIEVFPTFVSVTFMDDETWEVFQFSIGCGFDELGELKRFVSRNILLVGYNTISYDNPMLRFLLGEFYTANLTKQAFELSKKLISDYHRRDPEILALRYPRDMYYQWGFMDLMKIMAFDRFGVSLKHVAIVLKHERIQDLPYPYNHKITEDEVATVLDYNINDVIITKKLFDEIQPQIKLREEIGKLYHVDVTNASDSKMGNVILEHEYEQKLGANIRDLRELRTKRDKVSLGDCIPSNISFSTENLNSLLTEISETTVYAPKFRFSKNVLFKGTGYSVGSGGLHSTEKSVRYYSNDDVKIITCDIASMYPTCMINNNIYPAHLGEEFVEILSTLTKERVQAKKSNPAKASALKITVNGIYGKTNSDTFWLEDAMAMLRVTISGQLYLLMLIEMLEEKGIHCISANTDGIECEVPKNSIDVYHYVCKEWEKKTNFVLEFGAYDVYVKRDVNNYIAVDADGKTKTKGAFVEELNLMKGYKHPIVPKAVNAYFTKGTPVKETIYACNDIFEFCISQKVGKEFEMEIATRDGVEKLQKTNRFFISSSGGKLRKRHKTDGRVLGLYVSVLVKLLNNYDKSIPFSKYDVNKMWYVLEAKSFIEEIETKQLDMFSMIDDFGKKENMFPKIIIPTKEQVAVVKEKDIKEANIKRNIFNVDPKHLLVVEVNTEFSPRLKTYSLGNGKTGTIKIKKDIFKKSPVRVGDVIFVNTFDEVRKQKPDGTKNAKGKLNFVDAEGFDYWATSYDLITNFSEFKRKLLG